ncbi:MAG TPA: 1,4-alpha-glucan branching protein GlgB, partial [Clostridia bacterium]|nr:1,4-alpha-glucan branching protein GlgB [Clostridia bacterium]
WTLFIPQMDEGQLYKYEILTSQGETTLKSDPFAFYSEIRPRTASIVYELEGYEWQDAEWMKKRKVNSSKSRPINIYEIHLGSWRRHEDGSFYSYRDLAKELISYVKDLGFTHIEVLPIMEHPFDGSWGYQTTGYFSATSRYGTPHDLMYFIDQCHQAGIGVILDWVPGHFCKDAHGLGRFNGDPLFEGGEQDEWGTYEFDFSRTEVSSFLVGNAIFWLDIFHFDGLRVDGVTSMLFLDFGKGEMPWIPNEYGGRENIHAINFLRTLNETIDEHHPDTLIIAEESTEWDGVTKPVKEGGLGFDYKWNMGWMNDTLSYMERDFGYRQQDHNKLTFSMHYAFSEDFVLPFSHDEVVHGKKSLIGRMPGDYWRQFAGLRALRFYQMCHPGKKLLFMGSEFGQFIEWRYDGELDWFLLDYESHKGFKDYTQSLNHLYIDEASLWKNDMNWEGFSWLEANNSEQSVLAFTRWANEEEFVIVVLNLKPDFYPEYRIGVPMKGEYRERFNTDSELFGGSGQVNEGVLKTQTIPFHGQEHSVEIKLPPLAGVLIKLAPKHNNRGG